MCGKPGKGRHGTSHHAKATYQIKKSFLQVEAEISVTKVWMDGQGDCNIAPSLWVGV